MDALPFLKITPFLASKSNYVKLEGFLTFFKTCTGIMINDAAICNTKRSIYVVGGKRNTKQLLELNLTKKKWVQHPDMQMDRRSPGSFSLFLIFYQYKHLRPMLRLLFLKFHLNFRKHHVLTYTLVCGSWILCIGRH